MPPRVLAAVAAGILVIVIAGFGTWAWLASQERSANAAYLQALIQAQAAHGPEASAIDVTAAVAGLRSVLSQYPSSNLAAQAAYEVGNLQYEARRWAEARNAYLLALSRGLPAPLKPIAAAAIGHAWEAEHNWGKAVEAYRSLLATLRPRDFLYDVVLLDLARSLELAGRKDEAIETYRTALKASPAGPSADETRTHLASLGVSVR